MSLTESIKTTVYCPGCTRLQSEVTALKTGWQNEILKNADQILTIDRLNAALTTANADYAAVVLANQQANAELAAAVKAADDWYDKYDAVNADNAKLRALCAAVAAKLRHGDFDHSNCAECGCDYHTSLRLLDSVAAGQGEETK